MDKRKLVENAVIDHRKASIKFDGEEFPYHIAEDGISVYAGEDRLTTVTVDILVYGDVHIFAKEPSNG